MTREQAIDYVARCVDKTPRRYRMRARYLFDGLDLAGKRVLDVGCGPGTYALWAAIHDAEDVLGIEPEADGSTTGTCDRFRSIAEAIGLEGRARVSNAFLEDIDESEQPFDVVVMYNVINHLQESLVTRCHWDPTAFDEYVESLRILRDVTAPGGVLIVADCGRWNFWGLLGRRSPLCPEIDWNLHQEPELWARMLSRLGFSVMDQRWSPWPPFTRLTANRVFNYFTLSHFVLRMRRSAE